MVAAPWSLVTRFALIGLALAGCFYTEQINQRPAIDIRQQSGDLVYRGSTVELTAAANDPENHFIEFNWRAYACTTVEEPGRCDAVPFHTETGLDTTELVVPSLRTDEAVPPQVVHVILEAQDEYGALARPREELLIPISNHAPSLELEMRARHGYTVDTAIELYAKVGDEDDGAASTQPLEWKVYSPMTQPEFDLVELDVPDPEAPMFLQLGKTFTPKGIGEWEVEVIARDPLGAETTKSLVINVVPDRAPCLAQWAPIAAPMGSAWPLTEPTLFQVAVVSDDLDPYPTIPGDAVLGTTTFAWSILQPGASQRTALVGNIGNQAALDPSNYAPGDIVELRVEIKDRNNTAIECIDANATCSVISDNQCIQRLTWRVEVR